MESTPSTFAVGYWRLLSLVGALAVLVTASWWLLLPSMPTYSSFGVQTFVPAATSAALLVFAIVTALMEMRQGTRWPVVFAVVIAQSLNFYMLQLVTFADYVGWNAGLVDWLRYLAAQQLIVSLGTVLAIHVLLWPFRTWMGWY